VCVCVCVCVCSLRTRINSDYKKLQIYSPRVARNSRMILDFDV